MTEDELRQMLRRLLMAQDHVTHWNEQGPAYEMQTELAKARRDMLMEQIVVAVMIPDDEANE